MDLVCTKCGEPWDVMHVLHESPELFRRRGSLILECPCCDENLQYQEENYTEEENKKEKERLENVRLVCELLGDDVDGAAANLEDFGLL